MIELALKFQDSYQRLCDRFREATGWPLRFKRLNEQSVADVETELLERGEYCWWQRVDDGADCIGLLIVDLPSQLSEVAPASSIYESMLGLAESIALLMSRQAQLERKFAEQNQSFLAFSTGSMGRRQDPQFGDNVRELLTAAVRLAGYQSASFYLLNSGATRLKLRFGHGLKAHALPASQRELTASWPDLQALTRGFCFVERKAQTDDQWLPPDALFGLAIAVQSDLVPLGTLWVYDARPHQFPDRELKPLHAVAGHLALILERLVLLQENEDQHRVQTELRLVSQQLNRMSRPELPRECGMDATYRCQSRHEISGDLCELLSLSGTSTAIVVGDASGNSIPAALVANAVKGALRSMSGLAEAHETLPALVMQRLNRALETIATDYQFMSLFYGVYNATCRRFSYCSAGHPAPILFRGGQATMLHADGFLLGILEDVEYECVELELQADDILVIYTDGISETHGPDDRLFGEVGIVQAIQSAGPDSIECILNTVWNRAEAFGGTENKIMSDDRSLLVVKIA